MGLFRKKAVAAGPAPIAAYKMADKETLVTHKLELYDDHLRIVAHDKSIRTLEYAQIIDIALTSSLETLSQDKSPIGRAIAGGVLFGGVGAVVGAASGIGQSARHTSRFHLIIAYRAKDGSDGYLAFTDYAIISGVGTFYNKLKQLAIGDVAGKITQL